MWSFAIAMWLLGMVLISFAIMHAETYKSKSWFGNNRGYDDDFMGPMVIFWVFSPLSIPLIVLGTIVFYFTKLLFIPFKSKKDD